MTEGLAVVEGRMAEGLAIGAAGMGEGLAGVGGPDGLEADETGGVATRVELTGGLEDTAA